MTTLELLQEFVRQRIEKEEPTDRSMRVSSIFYQDLIEQINKTSVIQIEWQKSMRLILCGYEFEIVCSEWFSPELEKFILRRALRDEK